MGQAAAAAADTMSVAYALMDLANFLDLALITMFSLAAYALESPYFARLTGSYF